MNRNKGKSWIQVQKKYESRIGRIAMVFPLIHAVLERHSWLLWGLEPEFGRIVTKDLPTKHLVEKIRASLRELDGEEEAITELKEILKRVEALSKRRNELFHSLWVMQGEQPVFISNRRHPREQPIPELQQLEKLYNSVADLSTDLLEFSRRNRWLGGIGLATRKKYGRSGANLVPKHHDTP
jgi:hypothetical protein